MKATSFASFVAADIVYAGLNGSGDIRVGELTSNVNAYLPSNAADGSGGDLWFRNHQRDPVLGSAAYDDHYEFIRVALGLKYIEDEYFIDPSVYGGYAPQTFDARDIRALQTMYGADYGPQSNNTNTVYTWSETTGEMFINGVGQGKPLTNTVNLTIWDGGGIDRLTIWLTIPHR